MNKYPSFADVQQFMATEVWLDRTVLCGHEVISPAIMRTARFKLYEVFADRGVRMAMRMEADVFTRDCETRTCTLEMQVPYNFIDYVKLWIGRRPVRWRTIKKVATFTVKEAYPDLVPLPREKRGRMVYILDLRQDCARENGNLPYIPGRNQ